jgi:hypothetical protein
MKEDYKGASKVQSNAKEVYQVPAAKMGQWT